MRLVRTDDIGLNEVVGEAADRMTISASVQSAVGIVPLTRQGAPAARPREVPGVREGIAEDEHGVPMVVMASLRLSFWRLHSSSS